MKKRLYWIVGGGFAFWMPAILLYAIYRWNVSVLSLNLASLTGLAMIGIAGWVKRSLTPGWGWVLLGIYVFGPTAILIGASFTLLPHSRRLWEWIFLILFCLFPPMTLWLATLNGMIISVLLTTLVLPILAIWQVEYGKK